MQKIFIHLKIKIKSMIMDSKFTTIYNVPEYISGIGAVSYFLALCFYVVLFFCTIYQDSTDGIFDLIKLIISSGFLITLSWAFILIICPIYFFIRFIMELYRYYNSKHKFYSTPHIEYIKLYENELFFKNTCDNLHFSLKKSDIINATLDCDIHLGAEIKDRYFENLKLTIHTVDKSYTIYPRFKFSKQQKSQFLFDIHGVKYLKQQIAFFKNYFNNFQVLFDLESYC